MQKVWCILEMDVIKQNMEEKKWIGGRWCPWGLLEMASLQCK